MAPSALRLRLSDGLSTCMNCVYAMDQPVSSVNAAEARPVRSARVPETVPASRRACPADTEAANRRWAARKDGRVAFTLRRPTDAIDLLGSVSYEPARIASLRPLGVHEPSETDLRDPPRRENRAEVGRPSARSMVRTGFVASPSLPCRGCVASSQRSRSNPAFCHRLFSPIGL